MIDQKTAASNYDITDRELSELADSIIQQDVLSDVAKFVQDRYSEAATHRTSIGVDDRILNAVHAVRSELSRSQRAKLQDGDPDLPLGVSATKVAAAISWVSDIVVRAKDRPWTISPTPTPSISPEAEAAVLRKIEEEFPQVLDAPAGDEGLAPDLIERAKYLKSVVSKHQMDLATKAAARMEVLISDQLTEGGWRGAYASLISDTMTYPAAIVKGPFYTQVKKLKWINGSLAAVEEPALTVKRVDPIDFYPSPQSSTTQDGQYVIEVTSLNAEQMLALASLPGYVESSADVVVQKNKAGFGLLRYTKTTLNAAKGVEANSFAFEKQNNSIGSYDVTVYHGRLESDMLRSYGIEVEQRRFVDAEVWECDGVVLLARLNPHLLGRRPYQHTSFRKLPGSFWGHGIPDVLSQVDRVCNAAVLNMVKNMAYSSGPMGEVDSGRLTNPDDANSIAPYKLIPVESDSTFSPAKSPAIKFYSIPSNTRALMEIYDKFAKIADDISGIPAYTMGNPSVAGAGRTLGGLSLLMGNAAKGIKSVISNMDEDVIQWIIADMYMINMMDTSVPIENKVEATVVANGSAGILQRELSQSRIAELLQVVTPYTQVTGEGGQPIVGAGAIVYLLREQVKAMGFDPDRIANDPELTKHLQMQMDSDTTGLTGAPPPSTDLGTPTPPLDGRSAPPLDPTLAIALPSVGQ